MYTLPILGILAGVLLTRKREFLTATTTIKDPRTWTDADYEDVKAKNPELVSLIRSAAETGMGLRPGETRTPEEVDMLIKNGMMSTFRGPWNALYVPATTRLTTGDIDNYSNLPVRADAREATKKALKNYFEAEEGPARNTPGGTPPIATPSPVPTAPVEAAPQGTDVTSITTLEKEYETLRGEYRAKIDQALQARTAEDLNPIVTQILTLNVRVATALDKLVSRLAAEEAKGTTEFNAKRIELTERLAQIHKEYAGLAQSTDQVTTLRKIREYEEKKSTAGLKYYLIGFGVLAALLVVVILFKSRSQPRSINDFATNPMISTPTASPALIPA
jgi:hypothetical protein